MQFASVEQVAGHEVDEPLQTSGEQEGLPALPLVSVAHVPFTLAPLAALQASHAPEHALLQHTLSEHAFVRHWLFVVHACPWAERAVQVVPLQYEVDVQSESAAQEDGQVTLVPLQR